MIKHNTCDCKECMSEARKDAKILSDEEFAKKYPCPCGAGCGKICNVP